MYMIYKRIKNIREDKDLTKQNISDMLHISRSAYSAYENGANAFPIEVIIKLSHIYNTSIDYLLGQTDESNHYRKSNNSCMF